MTLRYILFALLITLFAVPAMAADNEPAEGQQSSAGEQDDKDRTTAGDGEEEPECD